MGPRKKTPLKPNNSKAGSSSPQSASRGAALSEERSSPPPSDAPVKIRVITPMGVEILPNELRMSVSLMRQLGVFPGCLASVTTTMPRRVLLECVLASSEDDVDNATVAVNAETAALIGEHAKIQSVISLGTGGAGSSGVRLRVLDAGGVNAGANVSAHQVRAAISSGILGPLSVQRDGVAHERVHKCHHSGVQR